MHDTLGELEVPGDALYGAATQRAVENFAISGLPLPRRFIEALGLVKAACAKVNGELGLLDSDLALAIERAAREVARGRHDDQFPVDIFQTGSGTSSNMNANEVIATLAGRRLKRVVHPNDHVNLGQSSNDVFPTALHVAASLALHRELFPALRHLEAAFARRARELRETVKTGRTHLMDALPVTMGDEVGAWRSQVAGARSAIEAAGEALHALALGGTAVGSGVNAHPELGRRAATLLAGQCAIPFREAEDHFAAQSSLDPVVGVSGALRRLAVALMKIANDLRWMNSGPLAGLGEITLPALQPGSSIMPGKINPVVPEAVAMVAAQVMGNDVTVAVAGQSGNFQLNVMMPVAAYNLLQSIALLAGGSRLLADKAVSGFTVNREALGAPLERNPMLATALNPVVGYERAAAIARRAREEGRAVRDVAREMTGLDERLLDRLLDPIGLARGGSVVNPPEGLDGDGADDVDGGG